MSHIRLLSSKAVRPSRAITPEEELLILEALSPEMQSIVIIAIETGLRRSEILRIKSEHIDHTLRLLFVPITKNGYSRTVPLSRYLGMTC